MSGRGRVGRASGSEMTERMRRAHHRAALRRGRVVYVTMPAPAWVPDPVEPSSRVTRAAVRVRARTVRPGRLQPVGEAALRAVSDGSAVRAVLSR